GLGGRHDRASEVFHTLLPPGPCVWPRRGSRLGTLFLPVRRLGGRGGPRPRGGGGGPGGGPRVPPPPVAAGGGRGPGRGGGGPRACGCQSCGSGAGMAALV